MSSSSVFSSFLNRGRALLQQATGKRTVGTDLHGNSYYLLQEHKHQPLRRMVDYRDSVAAPHTVPMLWHSWLRGHRSEPPTLDELRADEERMAGLQRKVAVLKAADEKLRVQEEVERRMSGRGEREADMSAASMLRELESQAAQDARWTGKSAKSKT